MTTKQKALLTANDLAETLGFSLRHIWRMKSSGQLPKEINIGKSVRWRAGEIDQWMTLGCPSQKRFVALKVVKEGK